MRSKKVVIFPKHQIILEELGENIKLARKRREISTVQLAERADISRTTLFLIEKGNPGVALGSYFNVLRSLGLELDFLKLAKDDIFGRKLQDLKLLNTPEIEDKQSKLSYKISSKIHVAIKRDGYEDTSEIASIIGCSYKHFKEYLNENMYGFKLGEQFIDLDHIIPISSAKTEEEIIKLNHYTNLQLLPSYYNRNIKSDNEWNEEDFKIWFNTY